MKRAMVTGASSGIGAAVVRQLLADGWQVIGMSRSLPPFSQPNFRHLMVDVSQRSALLAALEQIEPPQAIIHAAGSMAAATLGNLDPQRSESLWRLHVDAAQTLVNHFAPTMGPGGRIVLLGSRTSRGAAGRSQYAATKAALVALARSWAAELAPAGGDGQRRGPRRNPIRRCFISQAEKVPPPRLPPLGRLITPQEVVSLVSWLLSEGASAMTGQELVMCGGASLG